MIDCNLVVSEFELDLYNYVHIWTNALGKGMNSFILQAMNKIVQLMFFYKDGLDFK